MNSAATRHLRFQQPLAFAASGRSTVDRTPGARLARSSALNATLGAASALFAVAYLGFYLATVFAVGAAERAESAAAGVVAALHDVERAASRGGALSYGDAAAIGLAEVAPRFAAAGAPSALSMNAR